MLIMEDLKILTSKQRRREKNNSKISAPSIYLIGMILMIFPKGSYFALRMEALLQPDDLLFSLGVLRVFSCVFHHHFGYSFI